MSDRAKQYLKSPDYRLWLNPSDDGDVAVDGVSLKLLADAINTPFYTYSATSIRDSVKLWKAAFPPPHKPHYAVKANSNLEILRLLSAAGMGFDVVSINELKSCLKAGAKADEIVFSGVGKTDAELKEAVAIGVGAIHLESESELVALRNLTAKHRLQARVRIRVCPLIKAGEHSFIQTGHGETKFGVSPTTALAMATAIKGDDSIEFVGLAMHLGSQIDNITDYEQGLDVLLNLSQKIQDIGLAVSAIDIGGGVGLFADGMGVDLLDLRRMLDRKGESFVRAGGVWLTEPGRSIIADAGQLITRVIRIKDYPQSTYGKPRKWVIVDAAMNDYMRPALYAADVRIRAIDDFLGSAADLSSQEIQVAGPICESTDVFGAYAGSLPAEGSLLMFLQTGAYGAVMSSRYNSRPLLAEVLLDKGKKILIRRPEVADSLWNDQTSEEF